MERLTVGVRLLALAALTFCGCDQTQMAMTAARPVSPSLPAHGSLCAARAGNTLTIEIAVAGIPKRANMVALGLKLRDGTIARPKSVSVLGAPTQDLAPAPRIGFDLSGQGTAPATCTQPDLCVQVTYELPTGSASADGSIFSLAAGDPGGLLGRQMGVAAAVSTYDGSLLPVDHTYEQAAAGSGDDSPLPPPPDVDAVAVSFQFTEMPDVAAGPAGVAIRPALAVVPPAEPESVAISR